MKSLFIIALLAITVESARINAFIVTDDTYNYEEYLSVLDKPNGAVIDSMEFFVECSVVKDSAKHYQVIQGNHKGWVKHSNVIPKYMDTDNNPIFNW